MEQNHGSLGVEKQTRKLMSPRFDSTANATIMTSIPISGWTRAANNLRLQGRARSAAPKIFEESAKDETETVNLEFKSKGFLDFRSRLGKIPNPTAKKGWSNWYGNKIPKGATSNGNISSNILLRNWHGCV
jgi:hypothetical protein